MASKTTVELLDDLNGKPAAETISFGLDGHLFEIDLTERNAKALRKAYESWVSSARRVSGRKSRPSAPASAEIDPREVRAWAVANGFEVSARGRIPSEIIEEYRAAGN
jgi:hypothetical protein